MEGEPAAAHPSKSAAAETQARLRQAMLDLCFERGYREFELASLLERADVDGETFHRHYDDLEDCFSQIYEEIQDRLFELVSANIADLPSWRDRLRTTAHTMLAYLAEDEKRAQLLVVEGGMAGERVQRIRIRSFGYVFDLLDQARGEAEQPQLSRATAEAIGGMVFLQMYQAFEQGSVEAVREKIPDMMFAAVLPYYGPEAAEEELHIPPPPLPSQKEVG